MATQALVAYAGSTGCDSSCAIDIAEQIAAVPQVDVDVKPLSRVRSIERYSAVYLGWTHPSAAADRELERFITNNAEWLPTRAVWIVHHHPRCVAHARQGEMKMTRLVATPAPARAATAQPPRVEAAIPGARPQRAAPVPHG